MNSDLWLTFIALLIRRGKKKMAKFNLIASSVRWFLAGFTCIFLLFQNYEIRKELNVYKSSHLETLLDVNQLRLMLNDFTEMAPREMERIAKEAAKDELIKLTKPEESKE